MVTMNIHIDDKKSEKVIKAVLDALNVRYDIEDSSSSSELSKEEKAIYKRLQTSLDQIKQHQSGQIELRDATELLDEL